MTELGELSSGLRVVSLITGELAINAVYEIANSLRVHLRQALLEVGVLVHDRYCVLGTGAVLVLWSADDAHG